mgnify:CR=1 FL=1
MTDPSPASGTTAKTWRLKSTTLTFESLPKLMGIVNVTPDSFSDGGHHATTRAAIAHCEQLLAEGADILDIGGESTRPGAPQVDADGEWARIADVLRAAVSLGVGRASYEAAVDYAKMRRQGGRNIMEHQAIGTKIADCTIKLELSRNMVWKAAWALDHPEAIADRSVSQLPLHVIARVASAEAVHEVTLLAAECFGAMGVMRDMPLQKYINDARICLHTGDGNTELKLRIAEELVRFKRGAPLQAAE